MNGTNVRALELLANSLFSGITETEKLKILEVLNDLLSGGELTKQIIHKYTAQADIHLEKYLLPPGNSAFAFLGKSIPIDQNDVSPNIFVEEGDPPSFHLTGEPNNVKGNYVEFVQKQECDSNSFRSLIQKRKGIIGISFSLGGNGISGAPLLGMAIPSCSYFAFEIIPGDAPTIRPISAEQLTMSKRLAGYLCRNINLPTSSQFAQQSQAELQNNTLVINGVTIENFSKAIHQALLRAVFVTNGGTKMFSQFLSTGNLEDLPPLGITFLQISREG